MHAFWLVLTYDLLEDRRIDDIIIKNLFLILYYIKQIDSKDKSGHDMKYEETYNYAFNNSIFTSCFYGWPCWLHCNQPVGIKT